MLWQVTEFLCFFRLNSTPLHMCTMLSFPTYYLMDGWVTSTSCSWEWVQKYLSTSLLSIVLVELLSHRIIISNIFREPPSCLTFPSGMHIHKDSVPPHPCQHVFCCCLAADWS